jgi:hypothetical protein
MTHLPFIVAAYALTLGVAAWLATGAALRLARARRRLQATEARDGAAARSRRVSRA